MSEATILQQQAVKWGAPKGGDAQALVSRVTSFSIDSMLGEVIGLSAERGDFLAIDVSVEPFWAKLGCLYITAYNKTRPIRYIREI